ncbi:MAG: hypothetical protein AABP62_08090 [Planctomycetota bacterium]
MAGLENRSDCFDLGFRLDEKQFARSFRMIGLRDAGAALSLVERCPELAEDRDG